MGNFNAQVGEDGGFESMMGFNGEGENLLHLYVRNECIIEDSWFQEEEESQNH
jgi:hypothetical protein